MYSFHTRKYNYIDNAETTWTEPRNFSPGGGGGGLDVQGRLLPDEVLAEVVVGLAALVLGVGQRPARVLRVRHRLGGLHLPAALPGPLLARVHEVVGAGPHQHQGPCALSEQSKVKM
jgi:hypothetical protein